MQAYVCFNLSCRFEDTLTKQLWSSSASYGPVLQSDGENHKGEENHLQDPLYVAGCAGPTKGKRTNTHLYVLYMLLWIYTVAWRV